MIGSCKKFVVLWALLISGLPALSACDLYEEGHLTPNRVQVEQERFVEEISLEAFDESMIAALSKYYGRHGDGPVDLTVTYDPSSRSATAMMASTEASRIITSFRKNGVRNLRPGILPVREQGDEQLVIVSFTSYTAHAPKDCEVMSGYNDTNIRLDEDYKIGCTIETTFAKQIARPKDLRGHESEDTTSSGRRSTNILEGYFSGEPNESLGGESSSGG